MRPSLCRAFSYRPWSFGGSPSNGLFVPVWFVMLRTLAPSSIQSECFFLRRRVFDEMIFTRARILIRFYTLVPAGILLGLGAAPMWASKATYLTQVGQVYAKITDQAVDAIIVRFFGFFFLAWQTAELWGNLISSLVLSSGAHGSGGSGNGSFSESALSLCGANFCVLASAENGNLERPPDAEIYEISSIYLACIFAAVIFIALFLDPLSRLVNKN